MPYPFPELPPRSRELVELWIDDLISAEELVELEAVLQNSANARQYIADSLFFLAELDAALIQKRAAEEKNIREKNRKRLMILAGIGSTLGCLIILIIALTASDIEKKEVVAFVDRLEDSVWNSPLSAPGYDSEISFGDHLELKSGKVGITFTNGTRLLLEGPCRVILVDPQQASLADGKMVLTLPQGSKPFLIDSAGYELTIGSTPSSPPEGNLYGIHYDQRKNLLQTSVYAGSVQVSPSPNYQGAEFLTIPVIEEVPIAEAFFLAFPPNYDGSVQRFPLQLAGDSSFEQTIPLNAETGRYQARLLTDSKQHLASNVQMQLLIENQPPRNIAENGFELPPREDGSVAALRIRGTQPLVGSLVLINNTEQTRRSDFLGVWKATFPFTNQSSDAKLRLRSDGTLVSESGILPPYHLQPSWYFRNGKVVIQDHNGKVIDEWVLADRDHLLSNVDPTLLLARE